MERERLREREPGPAENLYERIVARQAEIQAAQQGWEQMIYSHARRWETTPWGRVKWLTGSRHHTAMRTMSHYLTELPPGGRSRRVRFHWEAVGFVLEGRGYSVIDGVRYDWEPEDALCLAPGCAHQHFNADPDAPAQIIWGSMMPLAELLGLGGAEELPDDGPGPDALAPTLRSSGPRTTEYDAMQQAAADEIARRRAGRVHISGRARPWEVSRQARNKYYTGDPALGTATRLIRMFMQDLPPGARSGRHRHFNEAALYCLEGRGYSIVDGERHEWATGDLNIVHINSTHQHFNADPDRGARLLAIHSGSVGGIFDFLGQLEVAQEEVGSAWQELNARAEH
ncbi:MAG TPA: cupin domain-containing protein [Chloroflexota bacterium]|jgi:quercetin dioxygenase-like cupin family protein